MLDGVFTKTYPAPTVDRREILRYAGCKESIEGVERVLDECLAECENALAYRVCYRVLTAEDFYRIFGENTRLDGCAYAVIFAATLGLDIDRLIARYRNVSVTKSVLLQAIGTERIEGLCEAFCEDIKAQALAKGYCTRTRFSAGYGEFPLEKQKEFFTLLDCTRKIGLTLTDGLLMSPTKSVTAAVGLYALGTDKE